ncbi:MAG: desulfoferrodoxin [Geobacteraceae bacterium]|nr:desulfoferrodoxin [Geobacteraceae bacterium]
MAKVLEVYKCAICGNIVELFICGGGPLACCGAPMQLLEENTVDASQEKHLPVIERTGGEVTVKVGSVAHPMDENHYIQWIEVIDGNKVSRKMLKPGEAPEATFCVKSDKVVAREYCNLHGQWKTEA